MKGDFWQDYSWLATLIVLLHKSDFVFKNLELGIAVEFLVE